MRLFALLCTLIASVTCTSQASSFSITLYGGTETEYFFNTTVISVENETMYSGSSVSGAVIGYDLNFCFYGGSDVETADSHCIGVINFIDSFGNFVGSIHYEGVDLAVGVNYHYSVIGGTGIYAGAAGYIVDVANPDNSSTYIFTGMTVMDPVAQTTMKAAQVWNGPESNYGSLQNGAMIGFQVFEQNLYSNSTLAKTIGFSQLSCFVLGTTINSQKFCFGELLFLDIWGAPVGSISANGLFPLVDGTGKNFNIAVTGGTGRYANANGQIFCSQASGAYPPSISMVFSFVGGQQVTSSMFLFEDDSTVNIQSPISNVSTVQIREALLFAGYDNVLVGFTMWRCISISTDPTKPNTCSQTFVFQNPAGNIIGTIETSGIRPDTGIPKFYVTSVIGGSGVYNSAKGQVLCVMDSSGLRISYQLSISYPSQLLSNSPTVSVPSIGVGSVNPVTVVVTEVFNSSSYMQSVSGTTIIETYNDALVAGSSISGSPAGTTISVCVGDSTNPNANAYCLGTLYLTDSLGNSIGTLTWNGYTRYLSDGLTYLNNINGGTGRYSGVTGYVSVTQAPDYSKYTYTITILGSPSTTSIPMIISIANDPAQSTTNSAPILPGSSLVILNENLIIQNPWESGSSSGKLSLACFGISISSSQQLPYCFGTAFLYNYDGDPLGWVALQGALPAAGTSGSFSLSITGGTGYFVNAWGSISAQLAANGLTLSGSASIVVGTSPKMTQSVYQHIFNTVSAQAATNIGSIKAANRPFYDSSQTLNVIGTDNQLCVNFNSNLDGNGTTLCMQVMNFVDPITNGVLGQIYYTGLYAPVVEEEYIVFAINGGTGIYSGAQGQLVNGQNGASYSFQYSLWYNLIQATQSSSEILTPQIPSPQIPAPQVPSPQIPSPQVPSPPIPSPPIPSPPIPSPQSPSSQAPSPQTPNSIANSSTQQNNGLATVATILAVIALLIIVIALGAVLCCRQKIYQTLAPQTANI